MFELHSLIPKLFSLMEPNLFQHSRNSCNLCWSVSIIFVSLFVHPFWRYPMWILQHSVPWETDHISLLTHTTMLALLSVPSLEGTQYFDYCFVFRELQQTHDSSTVMKRRKLSSHWLTNGRLPAKVAPSCRKVPHTKVIIPNRNHWTPWYAYGLHNVTYRLTSYRGLFLLFHVKLRHSGLCDHNEIQ